MTAAALSTPLFVVAIAGLPGGASPAAYASFVGLVAVTLLFRAALKRRDQAADPSERRRLFEITAVEAAGVVGLSGVLAVLSNPIWIAGALLVPLVAAELHLGRRNWPVPFGRELSGVFAISLAVPAGSVLLGLGEPRSIAGLWLFFLAFHVGSVLRVGMVLPQGPESASRGLLVCGLGYHGVLVVLAGAAWFAGWSGLVAPLVFLAGAAWAGRSVLFADGRPELKTLGRAEGTLSLLFVLAAPWLLI